MNELRTLVNIIEALKLSAENKYELFQGEGIEGAAAAKTADALIAIGKIAKKHNVELIHFYEENL